MTAIVAQTVDGRPVYAAECSDCGWRCISPAEWYVCDREAEHQGAHRVASTDVVCPVCGETVDDGTPW